MTPLQYRNAIARLGLSQVAAAHFLGVDPRTSRSWISGRYPVPHAVALLLRLMICGGYSPEDVDQSS
jgi:DNA-binding transcriptional regulator YdaS (Cro superfamily)